MIHPLSGIEVLGIDVAPDTRCAHYHSERDIIAIRFKCCDRYYPCHACHDAIAGHAARQWSKAEFEQLAVLCGACGVELSIRQYMNCESTCPDCGAGFNPNCALHYELYFEI